MARSPFSFPNVGHAMALPTEAEIIAGTIEPGRLVYAQDTGALYLSGVNEQTPITPTDAESSVIIDDHFMITNWTGFEPVSRMNWIVGVAGTDVGITASGEAGHPGIIHLKSGTSAISRTAVYIGLESFAFSVVVGGTNRIVWESLFRITTSVADADVEDCIIGLAADDWDGDLEFPNGVFLRLQPGTTDKLQLVSVAASSETVQNGTTVIAADTWYRARFVISDPNGTPSIQMSINGVAEGNPITTNIPTAALGAGFKIRGNGGVNAGLEVDYTLLTQITDKED
jgi:hypothetical protein